MDELMNYHCIDYKKLLLIKAKELNISDSESHILLIIIVMDELNMKPINPQSISKLSTMTIKQIDKVLLSLLDKHLLSRKYGQLDLSPLYTYLIKKEVNKEEEINLLSIFEDAFGRSFSQNEISIINSFKMAGYSDEMIVDALNEAVKAGVINFRYIERILENWAKFGVKKRFAKTVKQDDTISQKIKDYNWWDNND
jgi:DnaD/phage-associated family protein